APLTNGCGTGRRTGSSSNEPCGLDPAWLVRRVAHRARGEGTMVNSKEAPQGDRETDLQRDDGGAGHSAEKSKKDLDRELDKSLEDSFPSSDPPSLSQPTGSEPAGDPK